MLYFLLFPPQLCFILVFLYLSIIFYAFFTCSFTSHGICINFDNQQIYYLINLYFFVACVGQPKSVLTRYLGTLLGFQNYQLLDFILYCDLFSSMVQLEIKHQLSHNCNNFDDQTSIKILDFQTHTVNIRNSLIHQRKLLMYFLIHLKNACNICRIFMEHSENIPIFNIPGTLFGNIPRNFMGNFLRIFREHIMGMFHEYSTNIYLPGG